MSTMIPQLLDRHHEEEALSAAIDSACSGHGGAVVIEAPAGLGKTALLKRARELAVKAGARVLSARATDLERDFAWGVVRQWIEQELADSSPTRRAALLSSAAGVVATVLNPSTNPDRPPGEFAILNGFYWFMANTSRDQPTVLLADDLHWADSPSLRFLAYIQSRITDLPLLIVAALRPHERQSDLPVVSQIMTDPACRTLSPSPLSTRSVEVLVESAFSDPVDAAFVRACADASGGNPLFLGEMLRTIVERGMDPSTTNVGEIAQVGSQILARRVLLRLDRMSDHNVALLHAVALLGDGVAIVDAAETAELTMEDALVAAERLERLDFLRVDPADARLSFIHPLIMAVVHDSIRPSERAKSHRLIASMYRRKGFDVERIAAHLIRTTPVGDVWVRESLRSAADVALSRGSPDSAVAYLRRQLDEPMTPAERVGTLVELGKVAQLTDVPEATRYLRTALAEAATPAERCEIAVVLGSLLFWQERNDEAFRVYVDSSRTLAEDAVDLRLDVEAGLLDMALDDPVVHGAMASRISELRALPPHSNSRGALVDCFVALHDAFACGDPTAVARRAEAGMRRGELYVTGTRSLPDGHRIGAWACAVFALLSTEQEDVLPILDRHLKAAREYGSLIDVLAALSYRGMSWLRRGDLGDAATDAMEAVVIGQRIHTQVNVPFATSVVVNALTEQGRLHDAEGYLSNMDMDRLTRCGHWFLLEESQARLLAARGEHEKALARHLSAGQRFAGVGGSNPAFCAWRSGAAECLRVLGRVDDALVLAKEEVQLARSWAAPGTVGNALRVLGLVVGGEEGLELLHSAVEILAGSVARLEYARALVDLGAGHRRAGRRVIARPLLAHGLQLAHACRAEPLATRAAAELSSSGGRPRRMAVSGPDSLTPSERRVAELAALGAKNRDIAQQLFITRKTVEVHLSSAYRKLGIARREQLSDTLRPNSSL